MSLGTGKTVECSKIEIRPENLRADSVTSSYHVVEGLLGCNIWGLIDTKPCWFRLVLLFIFIVVFFQSLLVRVFVVVVVLVVAVVMSLLK